MIPYSIISSFGLTKYNPNDDTRISFDPLLSLQRYKIVSDVINDFAQEYEVKTITEFGSGTFTLFTNYLLNFEFLSTVNQIDIDEGRIHSALHVISMEINRRLVPNLGNRKPLSVNVFQGNIAEKDNRVLNTDVVVGVEIIEHLFPNDFQNFPDIVFGFMKPKLVVFTTPNYDYNILFHNDGALRDPDHKFEFTRKEFEDWTTIIIGKFPYYKVDIYGIGEPPAGHGHLGYCSQMAVFKKLEACICLETDESFRNYGLIGSYSYFDFEDLESKEDKTLRKVDFTIAKFVVDENKAVEFLNEGCEYEHKSTCLPLQLFVSECSEFCEDEASLLALLELHPMSYPLKYVDDYIYVTAKNECEFYCDI